MAMDNLIVLESGERGLFITSEKFKKWHVEDRVEESVEKRILSEFEKAKFELVSSEMKMAKTPKYIFLKLGVDLLQSLREVLRQKPKDAWPPFPH